MAKFDGLKRFKVFWRFGLDLSGIGALSSIGAEDMKGWPSVWLALAKQQWMRLELKRDLDLDNFGDKCLMPSEYAFFDNVDW
jgi:hypothetical protein